MQNNHAAWTGNKCELGIAELQVGAYFYLFVLLLCSCVHDSCRDALRWQAQFAGRQSTELHAHVYFKNRVTTEDAYVMRCRKNGKI